MNYSYEIITAEPQHQFLSVRYFAEGKDDFFKNFNIINWDSEEDIKNVIEAHAPAVVAHWTYQETAGNTSPLDIGTIVEAEVTNTNDPTTADAPTYDHLTQYINTQDEPDSNNVIQWVVSDYPEETKIANIKNHRDNLLQETDWMMFSDTTTPSQAWLDYRQALRDVPQQNTFPNVVSWPTKPV